MGLLLELDGAVVDTAADGHMTAFNRAFKVSARRMYLPRGYACKSAASHDILTSHLLCCASQDRGESADQCIVAERLNRNVDIVTLHLLCCASQDRCDQECRPVHC